MNFEDVSCPALLKNSQWVGEGTPGAENDCTAASASADAFMCPTDARLGCNRPFLRVDARLTVLQLANIFGF